MKQEELLDKIRTRANENVQNRIAAFRKNIASALAELLAENRANGIYYNIGRGQVFPKPGIHRQVLENLLSDEPKKGWPSALWRDEEKRQLDEILGNMDTLQRLLMSPRNPTEDPSLPDEEE